jgi:hypothetical protein
MDVFLLWHTNILPDGEEDDKLIGVYASVDDAEQAKQRSLLQPGFCDAPGGFVIDRYQVGKDHWTEGFVTITQEDLLKEFGEE